MATKIKDLAVKVGEYRTSDGDTKAKWQTVGAMFKGENGNFIVLERWFNPAGVPTDGKGSGIFLSLFDPKQFDTKGNQSPAPKADDIALGDIPF